MIIKTKYATIHANLMAYETDKVWLSNGKELQRSEIIWIKNEEGYLVDLPE